MDFQDKIKKCCNERKDLWSEIVNGRLEFAQDLHAADAVYHNLCSTNFRTGKQVPQQFMADDKIQPKRFKQGRPPDSAREDAFNQLAMYLEVNDEEQISIQDLINKMEEILVETGIEPYGFTYMKHRLEKHFGDKITITEISGTEISGKENVVTFRHKASSIIHHFYSKPKKYDHDEEKLRIIETAAKLIKNDVKLVKQPQEFYPSSIEISSTDKALSFIPNSLILLLQTLVVGKDINSKVASLGQAIMQCIRPRALIAPLQIGLGIQLHHHFASKFLIDTPSCTWILQFIL